MDLQVGDRRIKLQIEGAVRKIVWGFVACHRIIWRSVPGNSQLGQNRNRAITDCFPRNKTTSQKKQVSVKSQAPTECEGSSVH